MNRSKAAFDRNPEEDKAVNPDGVDRESATLHVLRDGRSVGFINWYGIHPTTFGPEHTLISGDNKGYAAWLAEHRAGVDHCDPASAPFVAAFATSTPGDVTPNHGLHPHSGPGARTSTRRRGFWGCASSMGLVVVRSSLQGVGLIRGTAG